MRLCAVTYSKLCVINMEILITFGIFLFFFSSFLKNCSSHKVVIGSSNTALVLRTIQVQMCLGNCVNVWNYWKHRWVFGDWGRRLGMKASVPNVAAFLWCQAYLFMSDKWDTQAESCFKESTVSSWSSFPFEWRTRESSVAVLHDS